MIQFPNVIRKRLTKYTTGEKKERGERGFLSSGWWPIVHWEKGFWRREGQFPLRVGASDAPKHMNSIWAAQLCVCVLMEQSCHRGIRGEYDDQSLLYTHMKFLKNKTVY